MATLRATFDGKVLVPVSPVDLPTGKVLEVDVREAAEPVADPAGSPECVRRAMREMLPLDPADVRAMEQAIDEAKLAVRHDPVFDSFDDGESGD